MLLTLIVALIVYAIGRLNRWVACAALAKHMLDKGCPPPTDEEAKACAEYVLRKLLCRRE